MSWLVAAAAFAVAMMIFSTITSTVTECLHRVFHMRERGLRMMLEQLFDRAVWPRLADQLASTQAEARRHFVAQLTRNRAVPETGWLWWIGRWMLGALRGRSRG